MFDVNAKYSSRNATMTNITSLCTDELSYVSDFHDMLDFYLSITIDFYKDKHDKREELLCSYTHESFNIKLKQRKELSSL